MSGNVGKFAQDAVPAVPASTQRFRLLMNQALAQISSPSCWELGPVLRNGSFGAPGTVVW